jgi:hypothetical protein
MNLAKLPSVFRMYRVGAPLGDVVVLKLDALATAPHGMDEKLAALEEHAFAPDLAELRRMPAGASTHASSTRTASCRSR